MGDVKMRREYIRYEAHGKSFEVECPGGFASIDAIDPCIEPVMVGVAAGEWTRYLRKESRDEARG